MIKKTISYTDYNGKLRQEDFYFNYSRAEIIEMQAKHNGGLEKHLKDIANSENGGEIIATVKDFILSAYGKKSDDGKRFFKSPEISKEFEESEAYSELLTEFVMDLMDGNGEKVAEFANGLVSSSGIANINALPKVGSETEDAAASTT